MGEFILPEDSLPDEPTAEPEDKKETNYLLYGGIAVAVLLIVGLVVYFVLKSKKIDRLTLHENEETELAEIDHGI